MSLNEGSRTDGEQLENDATSPDLQQLNNPNGEGENHNQSQARRREKLSLTAGEIALVGLFVAIICVCAQISIPVSVPITLQTFAVMLTLGLLNEKKAFFAVLSYLILGAVGVPVFAGFRGGISAFFSPTGGFLIGLLFMPILHYVFCKARGKSRRARVISLTLGLILCFALGTLWFCTVANVGAVEGITVCVLPFILPEAVKMLLAVYLSEKIRLRLI